MPEIANRTRFFSRAFFSRGITGPCPIQSGAFPQRQRCYGSKTTSQMFVVDPEGKEIFGAEPTRDAEHMRGADNYEKDDLISAMSGAHREAFAPAQGVLCNIARNGPGSKTRDEGHSLTR